MKKPISPKLHGVMDYLAVPLLLAAGPLFHFDGRPAEITSTLAGVVLIYSLFTAYPLGLVKMIAFPLHRVIDIILGAAMIVSPFLLRFSGTTHARNFFVATGALFLVVVALTEFSVAESG